MKLSKHLLFSLAFAAFANSVATAQNTHFTQFNLVPTITNAAQVGAFEGTYRIGGLYRTQWNGGVANGFQTPALAIDVPINGFRKQDWIGIGGHFFQDKAGVGGLQNTLAGLGVAYHIGLDKKDLNVLSFGVQVGFAQRKVDDNPLIFQENIQTGNVNSGVDKGLITNSAISYTDFNIGADLRSKIGKKTKLNVGLGVEHLTSPKYSLVTSADATLPARFTLHATMDYALNRRTTLTPAFLTRLTTGANETLLQAQVGYKLDPKKDLILRGGLGYRFGDAVQALLGVGYGGLTVGFAYDVTATDLRTNSNARDGVELGVMYIGRIFKKPVIKPVIICPKY